MGAVGRDSEKSSLALFCALFSVHPLYTTTRARRYQKGPPQPLFEDVLGPSALNNHFQVPVPFSKLTAVVVSIIVLRNIWTTAKFYGKSFQKRYFTGDFIGRLHINSGPTKDPRLFIWNYMEPSNEMTCKITFLKTFTIKLRRSPNVSKYDCGDNYCGQFWKRNRYLKIIIERARPQYVLENRLAGRGGVVLLRVGVTFLCSKTS